MRTVVPFPSRERAAPPAADEVGAKAAFLARMAQAGVPVPPGAVLTTAFFAPWCEALRASDAWRARLDAPEAERAARGAALAEAAASLPFSEEQRTALARVRELAAGWRGEAGWAVRSSSPAEDLAHASYAGVYETRLGVRPDALEDAVRACFASSVGERVFAYVREHGAPHPELRFAVLVQAQIASAIAGVAFSIDPVTNDYDRIVVDASAGLGDAVVSGRVTPDHFVVEKRTGEILGPGPDARAERDTPTLDDVSLCAVAQAAERIEGLFGRPVDVEWAIANGALAILQARPVTTWVPLPDEMLTRPGAPRRLYADAALSKGITTSRPLSRLGLDVLERLYTRLLGEVIGIDDATPEGGLVFFAGGRMYMNLSNLIRLGMDPGAMGRGMAVTDALMADTLAAVDAERYRAERRPPWFRLRLLVALPKILWLLRRMLARTAWVLAAPARAEAGVARELAASERALAAAPDPAEPFDAFVRRTSEAMAHGMFEVAFPALLAGLIPAAPFVPKRLRPVAERMRLGLPGNVTVEMGLAMHRLARLVEKELPGALDDPGALATRLAARELPQPVVAAWDAFAARFGARGPMEMDVATPRYGDTPLVALRQLASMVGSGEGGFDPEAAHARQVAQREEATRTLLAELGLVRRALVRRIAVWTERYGGFRDTPKFVAVQFLAAVRRRALLEGERLVAEGRLDAREHVFDLRADELALGPDEDLRSLRERGTRFLRTLTAQVREFPPVIDSRGRILRPPARPGPPGTLSGMPVSPGVVRGPVRVLHAPDETLSPGDVLVAYTTDPGWTPLFVNAAAVVLEVGGVLQHGAVIAREYGKPCVVGIDRVVSRLADGQQVEVDGAAGTVRIH